MKTNKLMLAALALGGLVACQEIDRSSKPSDPTVYDLTAGFESCDAAAWAWDAEDEITVYDGKDVNPFVTAEGGETAVFSGLANKNADQLMAIYPSKTPSTTAGRYYGKVNMSIPSFQTASAQPAKKSSIFAAYAKKGETALTFLPMTAFLKIDLKEKDEVVSVTIRSNGGEPLTGPVKVGLFEEPTIEAAESGSASVTLGGDCIDGAVYAAVLPQTLSQGYTISFVNLNDERWEVKVDGNVSFGRNEVYDLGSFADIKWEVAVNPNPSSVPSLTLVKAGFVEADFNMVSEGSFEYFPDQDLRYRSPWRFDSQFAVAVTGHDGTPAVKIDLTPDKTGWHRFFQVTALRQGAKYTHSAWATCTNANTYFDCQTWPSARHQEIPGRNWGPSTEWKYITHTVDPGTDFFCDVIVGAWWEADMVIQYDEVRIIPEGYTAKSTAPDHHEAIGNVKNTTYDEISELGKAVAWRNSKGKLCFVLSDVTVGGVHYDTAIAFTENSDLNGGGLSISRFLKSRGKLVPVSTPEDGVLSIVPNDVFVLDGKTYLHYYAKNRQNPDNIHDWSAAHAGFLVSEDDGLTWTKGTGTWKGDGSFASASFTVKDGVVYAVGTISGRNMSSSWENFWMMKADAKLDITDPANWDYYTVKDTKYSWEHGNQDAAAPKDPLRLICGARSEPALVWNPKFNRFMLIYRDDKQQGLVYRDAGSIEEDWSGEKPLAYDDIAAGMFAPSVIDVDENGDLFMVVPQL